MARTAVAAPSWVQWVPWTDKKGRWDGQRATCFALLLLPAAWLLVKVPLGLMGARPLNAAIHSTGYWAVIWLVASLTITPAKAIFGLTHLVVLRRMIGNAALAYAFLHLLLYSADENWRIVSIVSEIAQRFYLTVGLVALVGLVVLGATSTDGAVKRMGPRWKRLHKLAYGIAVLALFHFILQTKADVSLPLLFVGIFLWLMIWRQMPAGLDRTTGGLAIAGAAATVLTLAAEWLWYRFGTHADPFKIIVAETDISFGLGPADLVALAGLCMLLALALRRLAQGRLGETPAFWVVLFALGGPLNELIVFAFGIDRYLDPGDWAFLAQDAAWAAMLGVLGFVYWRSRRVEVAGLAVCCVAFQIMLSASSLRGAEMVFAAAIALLWAVLAWRTWGETKAAALGWVPVAMMLAYGVAAQT